MHCSGRGVASRATMSLHRPTSVGAAPWLRGHRALHSAPVWLRQSDVEGGRAANHLTRPTSACDDRRAEH
eukprot:1019885-Rhodomonas_salina.1